jgi:dihydrolipoamide dehydrogenase
MLPVGWVPSEKVLTTDSFFEQASFPQKIAVIGIGAIGLELGQALALAGSQVVLFAKGKSVVGGLSDPELVSVAKKTFSKDMKIIDDIVTEMSIDGDSVNLKHSGLVTRVDQVLVAIGRKPNLADLGLERLGIELEAAGVPAFSKKTLRVAKTEIYLVGDVNRDRAVLHEASEQGRIAGYNSMQVEDKEFDQKVPLAIIFTSPQIASVGLSYTKLKNGKINFVEGSVSFENQGRAVAKIENKGMLKIFADPITGLILGSEIFAPEAEHLAHLLAWSIESKATVADLLARPFYHPVIEEGLRTALRKLSKLVKVL